MNIPAIIYATVKEQEIATTMVELVNQERIICPHERIKSDDVQERLFNLNPESTIAIKGRIHKENDEFQIIVEDFRVLDDSDERRAS